MHRTIQAMTSPKAIGTASRLFNATLEEILHELLQNSRRAGATRIEIAISTSKFYYQDNGCGLEDPQILVSLGDSGWNPESQQSEDPAGMGFFSLATRDDVCVKSHSWSVHLNPSVFDGSQSAEVTLNPSTEGFHIEFSLKEIEKGRRFDDKTLAVEAVEKCARYYPIPVFCNGEKVLQESFLANCCQTKNWNGITLGVGVQKPGYSKQKNVNFYGLNLEWGLESIHCNNKTWIIRVDIQNCPQLKMTLPRRDAIAENEFSEQLKKEALYFLLEYLMATSEKPHNVDFNWFKKAQELGVPNLQSALPQLWKFKPACGDSTTELDSLKFGITGNNAILVKVDEMPAYLQQLVWVAIDQSAEIQGRTLVIEESSYRGYSWYDDLPVLSVSIKITDTDGRIFTSSEFREKFGNSSAPQSIQVSSIVMELEYWLDSRLETVALPLPICFSVPRPQWHNDLDSATIVVSPLATNNPKVKVFELLLESFFDPNYDDDENLEDFKVKVSQRLGEALGGRKAGTIAALEAIALNIWDHHLSGNDLQIQIIISPCRQGNKTISVVIEEGAIIDN